MPTDGFIQLASPTDTAGKKLDTSEITRADGVVVQRQRLDVVNRYYRSLEETKTATGATATVDLTGYGPLTDWALQVSGVGAAPTAWTVNLEVSLDGVIFQRIIQHTTTSLNGAVLWGIGFPALYFKMYVATLTLGPATGIKVGAIGL